MHTFGFNEPQTKIVIYGLRVLWRRLYPRRINIKLYLIHVVHKCFVLFKLLITITNNIIDLAYVDDLVILINSPIGLQKKLDFTSRIL